jgi:alkanesulfonate monooxygenase SsuD/methylene tetrahydromethanopterin reductase-like flavin-dependent oxidoreductase (luciferase family)
MAEDAGAADLISGGRLQLGISRGSPEQVIDGFRYFGYAPAEGSDHAAMAREHTRVFLELISGEGFAQPNPRPMFPNPPGLLRIEPALAGTSRPDLVGSRIPPDGRVGRRAGPAPDEFDATH